MKRILLFLEDAGKRRRLEEWLAPAHEVTLARSETDLAGTFDLAIIDGPGLRRSKEALKARKAAEEPAFLPVLLVGAPPGAGPQPPELWEAVDEIIRLPLNRDELEARVRNLLRARALSRQVEARESLVRAKEEWEATFNAVPDLIAILDQEHRIVRVNQAMAAALGLNPEDLVGRHCYEVMHRLDAPPNAFCPHSQTVCDGREHTAEVHELDRDFLVSTTPLKDQEGRPIGSVHVARDITELKQAEEVIRRLANFPLLNPNPVLEVDDEGRVLYANPAAQGVAKKLGLPEGVAAFLPRDLQERFAAARQGGSREHTFDLALQGATYAALLFFPHDLPTARLYATDITARRQAEEELQRALEEAERRQRETGALLRASRAVMEHSTFVDAAWEIFQECKAMTGAPAGYIALLSPDGSENEVLFLDAGGLPCTVDPDLPMPIRGLREEAYRTGAVVFDNDFAASRHVAFLPPGHVDLENVLFAPLVNDGKVVGLIGLANKPGGFTAHDARLSAGFGDLAAIALVSRRAEERLKQAHDELEQRIKERTAALQATVHELEREAAERQQAEAALRESEAHFAAFMRHLPGIAAMRDTQGRYVFVNDAWEKMAGKTRDQWLGQTAADLFPEDQARRIKEMDRETITRGQPLEAELLLDLGGGPHWWLSHRFPILGEDGRPAMVGAIAIDITARKAAEAALKVERQRFYDVLEMLPAYVVLLTPDYQVPFANRYFVERFGESGGQRCFEYLFGRTEPCEICETYTVFKTNALHRWEWTGPDGRFYDIYDYPFSDVDGSPLIMEMGIDITERKRAEEALREQAKIMEAFFTHTITPMVFLDKDFNFIRVNEAYARACRREVSDFPGQNHFEFFPDEENQAIFAEVVRSKKPYQAVAKPFVFPDHPEWGVTYWDWTLMPILDGAGEVRFLVFSLNDVTERVRAEEARSDLLEILEATPDFVATADIQGHILYTNRAGRRMLGMGEEEDLSGMRIPDAHPGWAADLVMKEALPAACREGMWQGETAFLSQDGREIPASQVILAHKDPAGQVKFFSTLARDITDRKQAEEQLRGLSAYARNLIEVSPDPLVTISPEGKVTDVNKATEEATGVPRARLIGSDFSDYFTEPDQARAGYQQVLAAGLVRDYPLALRHTSGRIMDVLYNAAIYRNEAGEVQGVFAAARDVTARKQAEEDLHRVNRALRTLSACNQATVRATREADLLKQVCRIIVGEGGYRLAWVGYAEHDPAKTVRPVAQAGYEEGYLQTLKITWADEERGRGPTGTAIRTGRPALARNIHTDPHFEPWRAEAIKRGYGSSCVLPIHFHRQVWGALNIYAAEPEAFSPEEMKLLSDLAANLAFGIAALRTQAARQRDAAALRESQKKLRHLASQLLTVQEEERSRLSRELHDGLGQTLLVLKLQMRALERKLGPEQTAMRQECGQTLGQIDSIIEDVRRMARALSPSVLEDLGLAVGLRNLCEEFTRLNEDLTLSLDLDEVSGIFPKEAEINIYRIFQESLANAGKHAQASHINLAIKKLHREVACAIEDNGQGFRVEEVSIRPGDARGLGLATMTERVRMLGGELHISSKRGTGTRVSFNVPLGLAG